MSTNKNLVFSNKKVFRAIRCSSVILLCWVVSIQSAHAQVNLIVDPSMENYLRCPTSTTGNEGCYTWHSLDSVNNTPNTIKNCSPVYLNTCSANLFNDCPQNYAQGYSYMYPRTGNGMYINVFYCDPLHCNGVYNRDYLRGRIRGHLANGEQYCGKYYVSLYKSMMYAVDRFGAYLDNGALDANDECLPIVATPAFENPAFNYITDTTGWTKIEGIFTANGTESYITIGNFYSHANTHKLVFNPAAFMFQESIYYVDDVSIIPINITAFAGHDVSICLSDSIALGRPQEIGLECEWYSAGNPLPFSSSSQFTFKPQQTGTYHFIQKMDNCRITYDTVTVTVVEDCNSLLVIPNVFTPNEDGTNDAWHFEVKHATNLSYSIYNRWGNLVKSVDLKGTTVIAWDGRTTSGEACTAGVYFYVLSYTDAKGDSQKKNGYITLIK